LPGYAIQLRRRVNNSASESRPLANIELPYFLCLDVDMEQEFAAINDDPWGPGYIERRKPNDRMSGTGTFVRKRRRCNTIQDCTRPQGHSRDVLDSEAFRFLLCVGKRIS
jgi:hypothetical protein